MDQSVHLKQEREQLYAEYEYLVKHFLFCYDLIKRNPKKERVVLKRWDKEVVRNYNTEIIIALLLMKWFSAYHPKFRRPLSNGALITIRWIAFDDNCPYHVKWNKRLLEIVPDDYINCYYTKKAKFDMSRYKNTSFHKLAAYVSHQMFFDYMWIFLECIEYYSVWWWFYGEEKDYFDYTKYFHRGFVGYVNTIRWLLASSIRSLEKVHHTDVKSRKETRHSSTKKRIYMEMSDRAIKEYEENIKDTPMDDGDPYDTRDLIEANSDYWMWKFLCENKMEDVKKSFYKEVNWKSLELDYEIQKVG